MNFYSVDKDDCISEVGGGWTAFANQNTGVGLSADEVCARPYWSFIQGDATRLWLASFFEAARVRGKTFEQSYRCDSPELKRYMQMRIVPRVDGGVRVEHELLRAERRSLPVQVRYDGIVVPKATEEVVPEAEPSVVPRCSVCGRVWLGGWREPIAALAGTYGYIRVTYEICEDCECVVPSRGFDPGATKSIL